MVERYYNIKNIKKFCNWTFNKRKLWILFLDCSLVHLSCPSNYQSIFTEFFFTTLNKTLPLKNYGFDFRFSTISRNFFSQRREICYREARSIRRHNHQREPTPQINDIKAALEHTESPATRETQYRETPGETSRISYSSERRTSPGQSGRILY